MRRRTVVGLVRVLELVAIAAAGWWAHRQGSFWWFPAGCLVAVAAEAVLTMRGWIGEVEPYANASQVGHLARREWLRSAAGVATGFALAPGAQLAAITADQRRRGMVGPLRLSADEKSRWYGGAFAHYAEVSLNGVTLTSGVIEAQEGETDGWVHVYVDVTHPDIIMRNRAARDLRDFPLVTPGDGFAPIVEKRGRVSITFRSRDS